MLSETIKNRFSRLAEAAHLRLFGHEMGEEMRKFLGNLSWSFFGGIGAGGVLLIANIFAGRWLGPEEYGKYNLVLAVSSFIIVLMTLGIDMAAPRFVAMSKSNEEKISLSRFILKRVLLSITTVLIVFFILLLSIRELLPIDSVIILTVAAIFSVFLSLRSTLDSLIRGFYFFKSQTKIRLFESAAVLSVLFLAYFFTIEKSFIVYIVATAFGYLVFSITSFFILRFSSEISLSKEKKATVVQYGAYAIVGAIASFLFVGSDKLLVGSFMGHYELGLYSAYFTVAVMPMVLLQSIIVNVFFPVASRFSDKKIILKKTDKLAMKLFFPTLAAIFFGSFILLSFFGNAYRKDFLLLILFSLYAALFLFVGIRQWFLASISNSSVLHSSLLAIIASLLQLGIFFILLQQGLGLYALVSGIIFVYIVFAFLNNYFINVNLRKIYEN